MTVVVPCFNEEAALPLLIERLSVLAGHRGWQVLFVDDGSQDGTSAILEAAASRHPWLESVRHSKNLGLGAALRTGFAAARAPVVCTMDSDCTYPPERLPELVEAIASGADIATASPWHPDNRSADGSRWRIAMSRGASAAYRLLTGTRLYTYTALFRAYRGEVVRGIPFRSNGFPAVCEILVRAIVDGRCVREIPMPLRNRTHGVSKMNIGSAVRGHLRLLALTAFWVTTTRVGSRLGLRR